MFGVMGLSAAFAKAGSAHTEKFSNWLIFKGSEADPTLQEISCTGKIVVESIKNGEKIIQKYADLVNTSISIQADADTDIKISGDVTNLLFSTLIGLGYFKITELNISKCTTIESFGCAFSTGLTALDLSANTALTSLNCQGCTGLTALDLSANTALTILNCQDCTGLTALDLSANTALTSLNCYRCTGLTALDFSANTALTILNCQDCTGLTALDLSANTALTSLNINRSPFGYLRGFVLLKYGAANSDVSTAIAGAIADATAADGTVYTDSAGAYYSTIETAATAKGWTIEQL